jgi:DNA-binding HxlR family transcriptional regulator
MEVRAREKPTEQGVFAVQRTTTLRSRRDSARGDHRGVPKTGVGRIRLPVRPAAPPTAAEINYGPILRADEPAIRSAVSLIQGKWRIAILHQLQDGTVRPGELKRRLSPISKKVLNQHLRRMEKDGLIVRSDLSGSVPHVEYSLADPRGFAALNLLSLIVQWGRQAFD